MSTEDETPSSDSRDSPAAGSGRGARYGIKTLLAAITLIAMLMAVVSSQSPAAALVLYGAVFAWGCIDARRLPVGWGGLLASGLVFLLTYASAWVAFGDARTVLGYGRISAALFHLNQLNIALQEYQAKSGGYPQSLDDLPPNLKDPAWIDVNGRVAVPDPWGHPFLYERTPTGYRMSSLGRDGVPGGTGTDADIELDPHRPWEIYASWRPSIWQFLVDSSASSSLFTIAVSTSVLVFFTITLLSTGQSRGGSGGEKAIPVRRCVLVAIPAALLALFLAMIHAISSGH